MDAKVYQEVAENFERNLRDNVLLSCPEFEKLYSENNERLLKLLASIKVNFDGIAIVQVDWTGGSCRYQVGVQDSPVQTIDALAAVCEEAQTRIVPIFKAYLIPRGGEN